MKNKLKSIIFTTIFLIRIILLGISLPLEYIEFRIRNRINRWLFRRRIIKNLKSGGIPRRIAREIGDEITKNTYSTLDQIFSIRNLTKLITKRDR